MGIAYQGRHGFHCFGRYFLPLFHALANFFRVVEEFTGGKVHYFVIGAGFVDLLNALLHERVVGRLPLKVGGADLLAGRVVELLQAQGPFEQHICARWIA